MTEDKLHRVGNDICPKCMAAHPTTYDCTPQPLSIIPDKLRTELEPLLAAFVIACWTASTLFALYLNVVVGMNG